MREDGAPSEGPQCLPPQAPTPPHSARSTEACGLRWKVQHSSFCGGFYLQQLTVTACSRRALWDMNYLLWSHPEPPNTLLSAPTDLHLAAVGKWEADHKRGEPPSPPKWVVTARSAPPSAAVWIRPDGTQTVRDTLQDGSQLRVSMIIKVKI